MWFDDTTELPEPPDYDARLAEVAGPYLGNFEALDESSTSTTRRRRTGTSQFLAVHPDQQNRAWAAP